MQDRKEKFQDQELWRDVVMAAKILRVINATDANTDDDYIKIFSSGSILFKHFF